MGRAADLGALVGHPHAPAPGAGLGHRDRDVLGGDAESHDQPQRLQRLPVQVGTLDLAHLGPVDVVEATPDPALRDLFSVHWLRPWRGSAESNRPSIKVTAKWGIGKGT